MTIQINDLIGVPYRDHGRSLDGMDCYGLAIEVLRRYGYELRDVLYNTHDLELSAENIPTLNVTPLNKAREGAILEMEFNNEIHVGVCINDREFIHMTRTGCRINRIGSIKIRGIYGCNTSLRRNNKPNDIHI